MIARAAFVLSSLSIAIGVGAAPATAPTAPTTRAARSVHLHFPAPDAVAFYNELTVERSTRGSYFMACGFNHGYFGIQEKGDGHKVVLFSVWDPTKGDDARAVPQDQRVELLHKDDAVTVRRFGGEGTGGQCFFDYDWQLGQTCRFLVRADVQPGEKTAYAGYFYVPADKAWKHLVTFRTRTGGQPLRGLYSFVEDFRRDTKSAGEVRRATFGNGWVLDLKGQWQPLPRARFTASNSPTEARDTIDAGLADGRFFLQTGGDTKMSRGVNSIIERGAVGAPPGDLPEGKPETASQKPG